MIGGLVQNEQIDLLVHQHTQPKPGLFPARETPHSFEHIFSLEQEGTQPVPGGLGRQVFLVEHGVVQTPLRVREVHNLGQVSHSNGRTKLDFPVAGLLIQQAADQGGLSRAVVSQQGDALPALDQEVHIGKQLLLSEALGQTLGLKHHVSPENPAGQREAFMVFSSVGFFVFSIRSIRCWMDMARRYRVRLLMPQPFIRSRVKPSCLSLACSCSYCFICRSNRACFSSI